MESASLERLGRVYVVNVKLRIYGELYSAEYLRLSANVVARLDKWYPNMLTGAQRFEVDVGTFPRLNGNVSRRCDI